MTPLAAPPNRSIMFNGIEIIESQLVPKKPRFTLSEDVPVTQQFRDEFNEWARKFFGEDEQMLMTAGRAFVGPATMLRLRKATYGLNL